MIKENIKYPKITFMCQSVKSKIINALGHQVSEDDYLYRSPITVYCPKCKRTYNLMKIRNYWERIGI